jgi:serine/threonine-protein kinase RsbW
MPSFPARPAALRDIRRFVRERAEEATFSPEKRDELVAAVSEACSNAMRHSGTAEIRVTWKSLVDRAEVRVEDDGVFRHGVPIPQFSVPTGFGVPMMVALADEVSIRPGSPERRGTTVRLVKRKDPQPS